MSVTALPAAREETPFRRFVSEFAASRLALLGFAIFVCIALLAAVVGTSLGLLAAWLCGRADAAIMRLVDLQLSFPSILVALMILAILGKGVMNVVMALVIVEWAYYARTVRATAMVERQREYIEAAECLALPRWRIMF